MTGLLASCLTQADLLYKYLVSVRCVHYCHIHLNLQSPCVTRFRDSKATFGKLQFFSHLCKKLHQDMEEFAEILSPSRKGGLNYCIIVIPSLFKHHYIIY